MSRDKLIGLIYDAVADGVLWRVFLEELRIEVRADRATFLIRDLLTETFTVAASLGSTDEDVAVYAERYAANDPWNRLSGLQAEGPYCWTRNSVRAGSSRTAQRSASITNPGTASMASERSCFILRRHNRRSA